MAKNINRFRSGIRFGGVTALLLATACGGADETQNPSAPNDHEPMTIDLSAGGSSGSWTTTGTGGGESDGVSAPGGDGGATEVTPPPFDKSFDSLVSQE